MMPMIPRVRRRRHPTFPGAGWAFLAVGVGLAVLLGGGIVLALSVVGNEAASGHVTEQTKTLLRGLTTPLEVFALAVVPLLIVGWRCKIRQTLSMRVPKVPLLLLMIPLGVFLQVLLGSFMQWFVSLLPKDMQEAQYDMIRLEFLCTNSLQWAVTILAIRISPGVFEELLFRGILQNGLQVSPLGRKGALMVTAALFAVAHRSTVSMIPLFAVGLLLGYIALQTGTIWYGMVLHATFNFTAIWFTNVSLSGGGGGVEVQWPTPMLLAGFAVLAMCAVPLWIWTRPRAAALISGDQVDPDLEIELGGPPAAPEPLAELRPRPRMGHVPTAALCLLSVGAPAACYLITWLQFQ